MHAAAATDAADTDVLIAAVLSDAAAMGAQDPAVESQQPAWAELHDHGDLVRKIMRELIAKLDPSRLKHSISILGNLADMFSPPEKSPMWLDQPSAAALAKMLRAVLPRMLDVDVAVPLVVALMRFEGPLRSEEDCRDILTACAPYAVVAARWEVDCPMAEGPDLPTAHRMDAQISIARLCEKVAEYLSDEPSAAKRRSLNAPPPGEIAVAAACQAAHAAATALALLRPALTSSMPLQHVGVREGAMLAAIALQTAEIALEAVDHAATAANALAKDAVLPVAKTFQDLLCMLPTGEKHLITAVVDRAHLLTPVAEALPARQLQRLQASAAAAAASALEQAAKPIDRYEAMLVEAAESRQVVVTPPTLQQARRIVIGKLIPIMLAAARTLAAIKCTFRLSPGEAAARVVLQARVLRWCIEVQRRDALLLLQPLKLELDLDGDRSLLGHQLAAVADAAAAGLAADLLSAVGQDLSRLSRHYSDSSAPARGPDIATAAAAARALVQALAQFDWGSRQPPQGAWAAAHALVAAGGWVADTLVLSSGGLSETGAASDTAAGSTTVGSSAAGSNAPAGLRPPAASQAQPVPGCTSSTAQLSDGTAATPALAAATAASTAEERQQPSDSPEATTSTATEPTTDPATDSAAVADDTLAKMAVDAATSAITVVAWAMPLKDTAMDSQHSTAGDGLQERMAKADAQLRVPRIAAAAAGVLCDLSATEPGRDALRQLEPHAAASILAPLTAALQARGMWHSASAMAELLQLLRDAAAALKVLLARDSAPPILQAYGTPWQLMRNAVRQAPPSAHKAELQQALAAIADAMHRPCGSTDEVGGAAAVASGAAVDAAAAADAAAAVLLEEEAHAASRVSATVQSKGGQRKGKKGHKR